MTIIYFSYPVILVSFTLYNKKFKNNNAEWIEGKSNVQ